MPLVPMVSNANMQLQAKQEKEPHTEDKELRREMESTMRVAGTRWAALHAWSLPPHLHSCSTQQRALPMQIKTQRENNNTCLACLFWPECSPIVVWASSKRGRFFPFSGHSNTWSLIPCNSVTCFRSGVCGFNAHLQLLALSTCLQ